MNIMPYPIVGAVLLGLTSLLAGCESRDRSIAETDDPPPAEQPPPLPGNGGDPAEDDETEAPEPPEGGFGVVNHFPQAGDDNIALVTRITVTFNEPLLQESVSAELVQVVLDGAPIRGIQQQVDARTLQFIPDTFLQPNATYQVRVGDQVMSQSGRSHETLTWQFETVGDVYSTSQEIIDLCMSAQDIEMLEAVNAARTQSRNCGDRFSAAVRKLSWNCRLQQTAIDHAMDMASQNFFSHTGSDGSSVGERATRAGYNWAYVGENIAGGQRSVAEVMTGWSQPRPLFKPNVA